MRHKVVLIRQPDQIAAVFRRDPWWPVSKNQDHKPEQMR